MLYVFLKASYTSYPHIVHVCTCAITRASAPAFQCTHSGMCVFINIANGFCAGPTFVCSVTQPASRLIRQVLRAEAWARAVSELTPVSGRRGPKVEKSKIDLALRHGDILTLRIEKWNEGNMSVKVNEKGKEREPSRKMVWTLRAQKWAHHVNLLD